MRSRFKRTLSRLGTLAMKQLYGSANPGVHACVHACDCQQPRNSLSLSGLAARRRGAFSILQACQVFLFIFLLSSATVLTMLWYVVVFKIFEIFKKTQSTMMPVVENNNNFKLSFYIASISCLTLNYITLRILKLWRFSLFIPFFFFFIKY